MRINQIDLAKNAYEVIDKELHQRIPYLQQIRIDNEPEYIHQGDMFGNIDSVLSLGGSEQIVTNQNKSRNMDAKTICFECRSFTGLPFNSNSEKRTPIAGAHYVPSLGVYLSPRFGSFQTISYYMPRQQFVLHLSRYFLDILFSSDSVWQHVHQYFYTNDKTDTFIIYIDCRTFIKLYMQCVARVTLGDRFVMELEETDEE